ncbi:unnamed protein product [Durusdinium trenchii]|uniref:Uncharacterized protein n=2 Tax=Durusdinium trenchii TaxID=1381693 RepID=A0ABP0MQR7_9DINO
MAKFLLLACLGAAASLDQCVSSNEECQALGVGCTSSICIGGSCDCTNNGVDCCSSVSTSSGTSGGTVQCSTVTSYSLCEEVCGTGGTVTQWQATNNVYECTRDGVSCCQADEADAALPWKIPIAIMVAPLMAA